MSDNTVIKIEHISKAYKLYKRPVDRLKESWSLTRKNYHTDHYALQDINLEIRQGECIGIVGTNGSGKSTLLKIITGVLTPSSGSISVNGRISALLELGAGFNMEYTGRKNIYLNGTIMGYSREEMDKKLNDIIEFAEIGEFIDQPVKSYSSGMFARLAFAVAINVDPDILIVDEALSVGDIFFQAKCFRKFNEFQERGKTILFVSHDLNSVLKYCSRCLLINKGEQVALGDTADVVNIYKKILVQNSRENDKSSSETAVIADPTGKSGVWKDSMVTNKNFMEYGDGTAEIIDYGIFDDRDEIATTVLKGKEYKIRMKIKFYKDLKAPIFAYKIKDLKGTELTGTNTSLEGCVKEFVHEGDVVTVCFKQKMVLQGGQYLLAISCTEYESEQFVAHHRLVDICNIHVLSDRNTIGVFDNEVTVEYE